MTRTVFHPDIGTQNHHAVIVIKQGQRTATHAIFLRQHPVIMIFGADQLIIRHMQSGRTNFSGFGI